MARGRKNLTLDEQLAKITTEIENMETSLKEMKQAKKELEDQIRQTRLAELDEIITEKGLTFEQVRELLDKQLYRESHCVALYYYVKTYVPNSILSIIGI